MLDAIAGLAEQVEGLEGFASALTEVSGGLGMVSQAAGAIVGAFTQAIEFVASIPDKLMPFVKALNPTLIELFNDAIADFNATVGQAFEPVFTYLIPAIREAADTLAPIFEALRGPVEELMVMLQSLTTNVLQFFAHGLMNDVQLLESLMPVIQILIDALNFITTEFRVWNAIFISLLDPWMKWLGQTGDTFASLSDTIQQTTRSFVLLSARILQFAGMTTALDRLARNFDPVNGTRKNAAPSDFGITNIQAIINEASLASAAAGAGGAPRSSEDILAGISDEIRRIAQNGTRFQDVANRVAEWLSKLTPEELFAILRALPADIAGALKDNLPISWAIRRVRGNG